MHHYPPAYGRDELDQLLKAILPFATEFLSSLQEPQPTVPSSSKEASEPSNDTPDFVAVGEKILENLAKSPESENLKPFLEMGQHFLKTLKTPAANSDPQSSSYRGRCQRSTYANPGKKGKGPADPSKFSPSSSEPHPFAQFQEAMMKKFQDHQKQSAQAPGDEGDEVQRAIEESLKDIAKQDASMIEKLENSQDPVIEKARE